MLTTPPVPLTKRKRPQQSWIEGGAGLRNAWKPRVLEQGLNAKVVGVSNRDAKFLNLRKYQVNDIAASSACRHI
jgi:phage portal protein BeeE